MNSILFLYALLFALLPSVAVADDSDEEDDDPVGNPEAKSGYESSGYGYEERPQVYYGGQYGGRCGNDGFYYNDENSFVMCNHGIAYVQQCAPGTRNGMSSSFQAGGFFTHTAFCDVNLVDFGYAAYHSQRGGSGGYGKQNTGYGQSGYGHSSYGSPSYGGNSGYGSSRYGGYGQQSSGYKQQTASYHQPSYKVYSYSSYKPSYTSYQRQPSYHGGQNQGHSSYGRKYSGYYSQRRYH